jgi:glutaredoxin
MENKVILYEHGCPRCKVLKMKLDQKKINYENVSDVEVMKEKGFTEAPKLEVNGVVMNFKEAVEWIKEQ